MLKVFALCGDGEVLALSFWKRYLMCVPWLEGTCHICLWFPVVLMLDACLKSGDGVQMDILLLMHLTNIASEHAMTSLQYKVSHLKSSWQGVEAFITHTP